MVYYQATSFITKSKPVSRSSFCDSVQENHSLSNNDNTNSYYNNNHNVNIQRQSMTIVNNSIATIKSMALNPVITTAIETTPTSAVATSSINQRLQQQHELLNIKNESVQQQQQLEKHQLQMQQQNFTPFYATEIQFQQQQQQQQQPLHYTQQQNIASNKNAENIIQRNLYGKGQQPIHNQSIPINNNPNPIALVQVSNTNKIDRKPHVTATCNKPQFKCDYCGMTFGSKSAHTSHTKSHTKNGELGIISTAKVYNSSIEMKELSNSGIAGIPELPQLKVNLNAINTGSDPYQCNVCQKTFAVPARLIRHYRTHTGERPFECEFCHKLFSVKENLQVHRRIHTKERPYKCEVCGRAFEHSGKLHRHMRIHTGERPHKCETCGKTFIQSGQLVIHIRTHTGEKPYKCPVQDCKKDFTCSKQLKVHSRIHTGEKPYQCEFCKKCFGYNHVLKLHRRSHLATKCFQCNICEVTLVSKKAIEAHIKEHANDEDNDNSSVGAGSTSNIETIKKVTIKPHSSSSSTSSGVESISSPNSPQSYMQKTKADILYNQNVSRRSSSPLSPSSTTASISSNSSYHSISPHAIDSSHFDGNQYSQEHQMSYQQASQLTNTPGVGNESGMSTENILTLFELKSPINYHATAVFEEDMPKDLRITTPTTSSNNHSNCSIFDYPSEVHHANNIQFHYVNSSNVLERNHSNVESLAQIELNRCSPSINKDVRSTTNPALLDAACMVVNQHYHNNDVEQAAMQIMQLHNKQTKLQFRCDVTPTSPTASVVTTATPLTSATKGSLIQNLTSTIISNCNAPTSTTSTTVMSTSSFLKDRNSTYDYVENAANTQNILQHFKSTELLKQPPLTKGCAPVPKFQSSLHDNDIILRQVEAAIAPLRLSSDSPERSSSPEDSEADRFLMMADRDVMTLPLRKRKLYMSEKQPAEDTLTINESATKRQSKAAVMITSDLTIKETLGLTESIQTTTATQITPKVVSNTTTATTNVDTNLKIMRQNSVIKFAKAS